MRVRDATILGFFVGLVLGGFFATYIEVILMAVGLAGVIQVFTRKQVLTGPLGGFLIGITSGYFARELVIPLF